MQKFHLHLVSDATGETVRHVARACLVQFENVETEEHMWTMVRTEQHIHNLIKAVKSIGGFVIYTLVNKEICKVLEEGCANLNIACISLLDPITAALGAVLGTGHGAQPGRQHVMDAEYFSRIEAMQFALAHDDGQSAWDLEEADVILLGVSRTSKTPTSIYLANRGLKTANIPIVPGCPIPEELFEVERPLVVGLTKDPKRLIEIRRQRLKLIDQDENTDYVNLEMVSKEINDARRLYSKQNWPVINVSRKSIEETAATIIQLHTQRTEIHD